MLEVMNTVACAVLLAYCVPVANVISIKHHLVTASVFLLVVACLALQVAYPFTELVPPIPWPPTLLNAVAAIGVTAWRKDAWALTRAHLDVPQPQVHPLRRASDFGIRELTQIEAMQTRGRGVK